jgi:hypothetical protein
MIAKRALGKQRLRQSTSAGGPRARIRLAVHAGIGLRPQAFKEMMQLCVARVAVSSESEDVINGGSCVVARLSIVVEVLNTNSGSRSFPLGLEILCTGPAIRAH